MNKVVLLKENGKVTETEYTQDLKKNILDNNSHLCGYHCANANPNLCPKVCDRYKKNIDSDRYDFITDGYQIFDENGKLKSFIVSGCKLYKREVSKKKETVKDAKAARELREGLWKLYFGTDNIEEAYMIQASLARRGLISNVNGYSYESLARNTKVKSKHR